MTTITKGLILAFIAFMLAATAAPAAQREEAVAYEHRTSGDILMAASTVVRSSTQAAREVRELTAWEVEEAMGYGYTVESRYQMNRQDLRAIGATAGQAFALSAGYEFGMLTILSSGREIFMIVWIGNDFDADLYTRYMMDVVEIGLAARPPVGFIRQGGGWL